MGRIRERRGVTYWEGRRFRSRIRKGATPGSWELEVAPRSGASPDHAHRTRCADIPVARDQRQLEIPRRGADQGIEGIAIDSHLLAQQDLHGRQIVRLVGRIAEEVLEESVNTTPQTDPARTRE